MSNKLTTIAREVLAIESDLLYRLDYTLNSKPCIDDFEIHIFEQTWGSTTLGFSGIGGQAMTTANVYVFIPQSIEEKCYVYFAGRFAYAVEYSREFMEDVAKQNVTNVSGKGKYLLKEN